MLRQKLVSTTLLSQTLIKNLNFHSNITERFSFCFRKIKEHTILQMFLTHVKEFIALSPTQTYERHTSYDTHYLIKESKKKSWPQQKYFLLILLLTIFIVYLYHIYYYLLQKLFFFQLKSHQKQHII